MKYQELKCYICEKHIGWLWARYTISEDFQVTCDECFDKDPDKTAV